MALAPAKQFSVQLKDFQLELYFIELNYILFLRFVPPLYFVGMNRSGLRWTFSFIQ